MAISNGLPEDRNKLFSELLTKAGYPTQPMPDKIKWGGEVETFFLHYVVLTQSDWKDVAGLMGLPEAGMKRLTANKEYTPSIKTEDVAMFFKNVSPSNIISVRGAMDERERAVIRFNLEMLGIQPRKGFQEWTVDHYTRFKAFVDQNDLPIQAVVPGGFGKNQPCFKPDELPTNVKQLTLYRIGWGMNRALRTSHVPVESISNRLDKQARKIFDRIIEGHVINGVVPYRLPWHGHVQKTIGRLQRQVGVGDGVVMKSLGYLDTSFRMLDDKKGTTINIDRLIRFSSAFSRFQAVAATAEEAFGTKPVQAHRTAKVLKRDANKPFDVSTMSGALVKILYNLVPDEYVNQRLIPARVAWGPKSAQTLRSEINMSRYGVTEDRHLQKLLNHEQLTVPLVWLISVSRQLSGIERAVRSPNAALKTKKSLLLEHVAA